MEAQCPGGELADSTPGFVGTGLSNGEIEG